MKITRPEDIVYGALPYPEIEPATAQPVIPAYRYAQRLKAMREKMAERGLDCVLVYADREHFWNFKYFMGFDPRFEEGLLVINRADPSYLIMGNECLNLHALAPVPVKPLLCQEFSLPNQPMDKYVPMEELLKQAGVFSGAKIGIADWKMFTDAAGNVRKQSFAVPAFVLSAAVSAVGRDGSVESATDMLIHSGYGLRIRHDADTIALFEYGASIASDAARRQMDCLKPGMKEGELANEFKTYGLQHNLHPFALAGENSHKGLICSSDYEIRLGDGLNLCLALEGGLTCRHGYVAESVEDLKPEFRNYVDDVVKPYYAAVVSWYENMRIGVTGGEIYDMIQEIFPKEKYGWNLNPGHLGSNEEWQSSPFYKGSEYKVVSGMVLQVDIIPEVGGYNGPNVEDGMCVADEALRAELKEKYPDVYARMQARRDYLINVIGIQLPEEILPFSNIPGIFRPFMMNAEMGMKVAR